MTMILNTMDLPHKHHCNDVNLKYHLHLSLQSSFAGIYNQTSRFNGQSVISCTNFNKYSRKVQVANKIKDDYAESEN